MIHPEPTSPTPPTPDEETRPAPEPRYWKISPGRGASEWPHFVEREVIAFGEHPTVPDMRELRPASQKELEAFFQEHVLVDSDRSPERAARRMWQFYHEMQPGDFVSAYGNRTVLGWGVIKGDYVFEQDEFGYAHRRRVQWLTTEPAPAQALPEELQTKLKQPITIVPLTAEEFAAIQATFSPDVAAVQRIVERLLPVPEERKQVLSFLADTLELAHRTAPDQWSVPVYPDQLRLNVGHVAVLTVREKVWLALDRHVLEAAPDGLRERLGEGAPSLPSSGGLTLRPDELAVTAPVVAQAQQRLLDRAAEAGQGLKADFRGAHRPELLEYLRQELGRDLPNPDYRVEPMIQAPTPNVWWVCQGRSWKDERAACRLWAPKAAQEGERNRFYWEALKDVQPGDLFVNYANGAIRALSRAVSAPYEAPRPPEKGSDGPTLGRQIELEYFDLSHEIPPDQVAAEIYALRPKYGPISSTKGVNQGYLYSLGVEGLAVVHKASTDEWPVWAQRVLDQPPSPSAADPTPGQSAPGIQPILDRLQKEQLTFSPEVLSNYLLALQTKRFVILSGISGTGKTQLALAVAKYFPKRTSVSVASSVPEGALPLTVKPSNLKYRRIMVPVALIRNMRLPATVDEKTSGLIPVSYPGGSTQLRLYLDVRPGSIASHLLFDASFRTWFEQNLKDGDTYYLDLEPTEGEGPDGLRFYLPGTTRTREELQPAYEVVPVRPDWTDNRGLLGYYNPITGTYRPTPFLELLIQANTEWESAQQAGCTAHPYFLILDEMNLARVEHYFSDFLSCLESDEPLHLHDDPTLEAGETEDGPPVPRRLRIPPNLFFTGTVNIDETTHMFSPKVLDRAFTLEFNEVDLRGLGAPDGGEEGLALERFPGQLQLHGRPSAAHWAQLGALNGELQQLVIELHELLQRENRHFGYRVANEIAAFVTLAAAQAGSDAETLRASLDLALLQKVLPKFHGTQQELERPLGELLSFTIGGQVGGSHEAEDWHSVRGRLVPRPDPSRTALLPPPVLPRTAAKVWRMLRRLRAQGFTSFME